MNYWTVTLHNSVKRGNAALWDIGDRIRKTWRRSSRAIGGYWIGTCDYTGTRDDMLEMFLEGMAREVTESTGGMVTWQGYIAEMELTLDGIRYIRSMVNLANAVKCIYTRIGDTLLNNGGAEAGAWVAGIGGPASWTGTAIVTQSTEWVNIGTYSCKIVSPGGVQGAWVQGSGYVIPIVAGTAYSITGIVNAISGSWRISCNRADTDAPLAVDSTRGQVGEKKISITIPTTNTYTGMVDLRITSEGSSGTIYADSFYMGTAAVPAQTGWKIDTDSMAEYGRCELALLEAAMTSNAANAKVATTLKKQAWPKTLPPSEFTLVGADMLGESKDKLTLTVHGYCYTLANKYSLTVGTAAASNHVKALINEAEFVTQGGITSNALDYQIDSRAPIKHWQILMDILKAGNAEGNRWVGGVAAGRYFDYGLADNQIAYHYRGGRFYHPAGGELEPWFAEPGHLLYLDDAPIGPGQISGNLEDDPHIVFVSEVEMGPATKDYPLGTLTMKHEDLA
jgi:hypothetical protein